MPTDHVDPARREVNPEGEFAQFSAGSSGAFIPDAYVFDALGACCDDGGRYCPSQAVKDLFARYPTPVSAIPQEQRQAFLDELVVLTDRPLPPPRGDTAIGAAEATLILAELAAVMAAAEAAPNKLEAALTYARAGVPVFPCIPNGKKPVCPNGFHAATTVLDQVRRWWSQWPDANIAFEPDRIGLGVLDRDPKNGGDASLAQLEAKHKPLNTLIVGTPSTGGHYYFIGSLPATAGTIAPGLDTRGVGSYVLLPGSVIDGKAYRVTSARPVAPVPAWITESVPKKQRDRRERPADVELDQPWNVDRARQYLLACGPAVEGQGGDNWTYRVACGVLDQGVSADTATMLMLQYWNDGCVPPWSPADIETKVTNAWEYQQNEPGCDALDAEPEPIEIKFAAAIDREARRRQEQKRQSDADDSAEAQRKRYRFSTPEEDANRPPLEFYDRTRAARKQGILPKHLGSYIVVSAPKSSHKTGVVIKECLDAIEAAGAKVLYVALEGAHGIRAARLPAAVAQRGKSLADIKDHWRTLDAGPNITSPASVDEFIAACREEGFVPDIIVLDTLTRATPGEDINGPGVGSQIAVGLDALAQAFNATVIAVTHPGKDTSKGSIGSVLIDALAFAIWRVTYHDESIFLHVEKMKDAPDDFTVGFRPDFSLGPPVIADGAVVAEGKAKSGYMAVRAMLSAHQVFGEAGAIEKGMTEDRLAGLLAGKPPEKSKADEYNAWINEKASKRIMVEQARKRSAWAQSMVAKLVPRGVENDKHTLWHWFIPVAKDPLNGLI